MYFSVQCGLCSSFMLRGETLAYVYRPGVINRDEVAIYLCQNPSCANHEHGVQMYEPADGPNG